MKTAAVIAECNPYHLGHQHLFREIRARGYDAIVLILSGNYVQRGDIALFDKWTRAEALLADSVDLILEMPLCSVLNAAPDYAAAGVFLAESLGGIDTLFFGSECGNLALLNEVADNMAAPEGQERIAEKISAGVSYPRAVAEAIGPLLAKNGISSEKFFTPNNILGLEYLKSGRKMGVSFGFETIPRVALASGVSGAKEIRSAFVNGETDVLERFCPGAFVSLAQGAPTYQKEQNELGMLTLLRGRTKADFAELAGAEKGTEQLLYDAIHRADHLEELFALAKTKRYTMARIRRMIFAAFLGISARASGTLPPYLRLLGMNDVGEEVLSACNPTLPLSASLLKLEQENATAALFAQKEVFGWEMARTFAAPEWQKGLPVAREYKEKLIRV